jgi:uracil-DNA glycosylase
MLLDNCRITNAVRCLPPANKPTTAEIRQCNTSGRRSGRHATA